MEKKKIAAIDVHVGRAIRRLREANGLSQAALGQIVGVTFQQIQKYERGVSGTSSGRLYQFATVFQVGVDAFFPEGNGEEAMPIAYPASRRLNAAALRMADRIDSLPASIRSELVLAVRLLASLSAGRREGGRSGNIRKFRALEKENRELKKLLTDRGAIDAESEEMVEADTRLTGRRARA